MRVLYVCTGNSYRSPLAEALTRRLHPDMEVESAGIQAVEFVAEVTKDRLDEKEALEFVKPSPDQISQRALDEADRVVCMMPKHSEYIKRNFEVDPGKVTVWEIEDPIHPDVNESKSFEEIEEKVKDERW